MTDKIEIKRKSEKEKSQAYGLGHIRGKVFSELREFRKYLRKVTQINGVNQKWLNSWKPEVEETVWLLFRGMLLERLKESHDFLSPLKVREEEELDATVARGDESGGEIQWYSPLKVNTVSSIYRYSQSQNEYRKGYNPGKSVPKVYFSGLWLKKYGFERGEKYAVYGFKNYLVLKRIGDREIPGKIGDRMVKDSSITIGRINS